ncbi:glycosyl hydrolase family 65 protein [Lapidilactobacillus gannanensis]|uniref:Glycosyl hydrolase family 65 protein n=1 Tax=Lapidilactobacillus gannanensis TaxID=2486002 RepID=A0ABW4BJC0_9LACO|nr:glycosyl hydrolase family 65 protein [Lapidilactobacillus gannanensis]
MMKNINRLLAYSSGSENKVYERFFDVDHQQKFESIFCMGNGYLGLRATHEETYPDQVRGLFVNGTFQSASGSTVPELPNFPDIVGNEINLDGHLFDLTRGKLSHYKRYLNLSNGECVRKVDWELAGQKYHLEFRRFVSFAEKHLIAAQIKITPAQATTLTYTTSINGQVGNHGTQYFADGQQRHEKDDGLSYRFSGLDKNLDAVIYQLNTMSQDPEKVTASVDRRRIDKIYEFALAKDQTFSFETYSAITTSRDRDAIYHDPESLSHRARHVARAGKDNGYQKNRLLNSRAWKKEVWQVVPIEITSTNSLDQLLLNFGRYHLHVMTASNDDLTSIAAKGLSGEGYKGHAFWDTDMFIFPYFQYEFPKIARHLINYRYQQLPASRRNAVTNGYRGAQYPWESADVNHGETTPKWASFNIDTGKPSRIWTGEIEVHITADVAYTLMQYCAGLPEDDDYFMTHGLEILFDTAHFWTSRVRYDQQRRRYEILDVIGPDEYKEHVDNNAYTNYMAFYNMDSALQWIFNLKNNPVAYARFDQDFNLTQLQADLERITANFYLPKVNEDNILPENDTFLRLPDFNTSQFQNPAGDHLLRDMSIDTVNQYQICKQADVVLLLQAFRKYFTQKSVTTNIDYYEARTQHDSSLSYGSYAIVRARNNQAAQAYDLFHQAGLVDLNDNPKASDVGIHAAAMAQIWNSVVQGFAGVQIEDGLLKLAPHLPKEWTKLTFPIFWRGEKIYFEITDQEIVINNSGKAAISIIQDKGNIVEIPGYKTITCRY